MAVLEEDTFRCEVESMQDGAVQPGTRVVCHGRLVIGQTEALRKAVQPLLAAGGRIVIDCSDLAYVDSMGLGTLVSLKVSSMHKGSATLEFVNLTPRIKDLLRITHLTEYLARPDTINYGG